MKFKEFFSAIFIFLCMDIVNAKVLCTNGKQISPKAVRYEFYGLNKVCQNYNNCWIGFKSPEDTFKIEANAEKILELSDSKNYVENEYFMYQINNAYKYEKIAITSNDLNTNVQFQNELCLSVGTYKEIKIESSIKWFFYSGISLYSAFFLFLISLFLTFVFYIDKSHIALSLLCYSVISSIYLFSFSGYTRFIFDPVFASGALHFPLRLLQDLFLVLVFGNFYNTIVYRRILKYVIGTYCSVIVLYLIFIFVGIKEYQYYSRIILLFAPLVAAPMALGLFFSIKTKDPFERKITLPLSVVLFCFQLNDLLLFWGIIDSIYTVKFYIPIIIVLILFLYFRRNYIFNFSNQLGLSKLKIIKEFVHDVKSPLSVLKVFFNRELKNNRNLKTINLALDRVEKMILELSDEKISPDNKLEKVNVHECVKGIVSQKIAEFSDLEIDVKIPRTGDVYINFIRLERMLSNIINNAYESYSNTLKSKRIEISANLSYDSIYLRIQDFGCGIPLKNINKILNNEISTKHEGNGIGLPSAIKYLNSIGGNLKIMSSENNGTCVEIQVNLAMPEIDQFDQALEASDEDQSIISYVLIDDDDLVRLSWEYHSSSFQQKVKTYSSIDGFLEEAHIYSKNCLIYVDVNINGENIINRLNEIYNLGFLNIYLATGERAEDIEVPSFISGVVGKLPPKYNELS
jgi:signal transduction histidine kinase